jgi:hypothetical protein
MKQLALFLFVAFGFVSYGQSPYIVSIEILPQNPSTNDEVFLATHVATGNLGQYLGSIVDVTSNTVTVESCYFEGWLTQTQEYYDTISIGFLSSGNFNLSYTGYISSDYINCDYQQSNNQDTSFFVEQYVSLDEIDNDKVMIYPNPTKTGDIYVTSQSSIESINIVDLQGNHLPIDYILMDDKYLVKFDNFSEGIYLLTVSFASGKKIRNRISLI